MHYFETIQYPKSKMRKEKSRAQTVFNGYTLAYRQITCVFVCWFVMGWRSNGWSDPHQSLHRCRLTSQVII